MCTYPKQFSYFLNEECYWTISVFLLHAHTQSSFRKESQSRRGGLCHLELLLIPLSSETGQICVSPLHVYVCVCMNVLCVLMHPLSLVLLSIHLETLSVPCHNLSLESSKCFFFVFLSNLPLCTWQLPGKTAGRSSYFWLLLH